MTSTKIKEALLNELFEDADQLIARLDTLVKRVDYQEGKLLQAAEVLTSAATSLQNTMQESARVNREMAGQIIGAELSKVNENLTKVIQAQTETFGSEAQKVISKELNRINLSEKLYQLLNRKQVKDLALIFGASIFVNAIITGTILLFFIRK